MLIEALIAAGDLGRLQEIARVLVRHGFGDVVRRSGIARLLERAGKVLHVEAMQHISTLTPPEHMRAALEELGPTFVKLGQVLASRSDLLPPEWTHELRKLHEGVVPVPYEELRSQLVEDLGAPPEGVFSAIDTQPLAAGSIAQVHRAKLAGGREIVLKIRRPSIQERVAADLRLLLRLAEIGEREVSDLARFQPRRIAKEFQRTMRAELDLGIESRNMASIAERMAGVDDLVIPRVHAQWSGPRLLVMDYLEGLSAAQWIAGVRPPDLDPRRIARLGAGAIVTMIFEHGVYHADPHPGNVLFLAGGRLGLLDFGMIGRLSEARRREFVLLLGAIVDRDEEAVADALLAWAHHDHVDRDSLLADVRGFLDRYHGVAIGELDIGTLLLDVAEIVRENRLVLPSDVAMLIKVFVTLEGLGLELDPSFDVAGFVEPAATKLMRRLASPRRILRANLRDLRALLLALPADLRALLSRMRRGGFKIDLDLERLEQFGLHVDKSSNRIAVGLITSALIVGSAIVMTVDVGPRILGLPAMGMLGFLASGILGAFLLWTILRSGVR